MNADKVFDVELLRVSASVGLLPVGPQLMPNGDFTWAWLAVHLTPEQEAKALSSAQVDAGKLLAAMLAARDHAATNRGTTHRARAIFNGQLAYERKAMGVDTWTQLNGGPGGNPTYPLNLEPPPPVGLWLMDGVEGDAT